MDCRTVLLVVWSDRVGGVGPSSNGLPPPGQLAVADTSAEHGEFSYSFLILVPLPLTLLSPTAAAAGSGGGGELLILLLAIILKEKIIICVC